MFCLYWRLFIVFFDEELVISACVHTGVSPCVTIISFESLIFVKRISRWQKCQIKPIAYLFWNFAIQNPALSEVSHFYHEEMYKRMKRCLSKSDEKQRNDCSRHELTQILYVAFFLLLSSLNFFLLSFLETFLYRSWKLSTHQPN